MSIELDPRVSIIEERLKSIKRIIAVTGFKGGIGKSAISCSLALALNERGFKTGLFDLDFSGDSDYLFLGVKNIFPREDKGIIPPYIHGIKFMTSSYFSSGKGLPLRGKSISNAIKELFTVTIWNDLDFLIMDMPPGLNDTAMDIIKFIKKSEILPIQIPSLISKEVLNRSLSIYKELNFKILGTIENMAIKKKKEFLSQIFYDKNFENAIGNIDKIIKTQFYKDVFKLSKKIV